MNEEKVIYMILKDGTGSGIIECKMGLNNLICYRIPRTRLKEATKLTGINNNGIYILFGDDTMTGKKIAYIGKSSDMISRLYIHKREKDFWNEALVFVTENNELNQAHTSFIECKLCEEAKKSDNRYVVMNDQNPKDPNLSRPEELVAKDFIGMIKVFVSTFKYDLFEGYEKQKSDENVLYLNIGGEELGKAIVVDEGFLVLKGSKIRRTNHKIPESLLKRYIEEINSADIVNDVYVCDHLFKSPSIGALVLSGSSLNGRTYWKNNKGKTLKEIEEEK